MSYAPPRYTSTSTASYYVPDLKGTLDQDDPFEYYRKGGRKGAQKRMLSAYLKNNIRGSLVK